MYMEPNFNYDNLCTVYKMQFMGNVLPALRSQNTLPNDEKVATCSEVHFSILEIVTSVRNVFPSCSAAFRGNQITRIYEDNQGYVKIN